MQSKSSPPCTRGTKLLSALNAASVSLQSSIWSETEVYHAVSEQIRKLGYRGGLSLLDESRTRLTIRSVAMPKRVGEALEKLSGYRMDGYTFEIDQVDVYKRALSSGELQFTVDSKQITLQLLPAAIRPIAGQVLSILGSPPSIHTPIKCGNKVLGVLNIAGDALTPDDIPAMEAIATQIGIAIENAHLLKRAATERRHLKLLFDINRELATSLNADEILDRAITLTCQALEGTAGQAYLYAPEEGLLKLRALYGKAGMTHEEMEARVSLHLGEGLAGWVAGQLEPVLVQDVTNDPRWMHVDGIDDHVRAAISAPFTVAEQLLGVISVLSPLPGAFLPEHIDLLLAICQEIGLALSNARQYQQVQRRLAEITLIQDLAEIFNRRLDLQNLLDEVVLQLVQRFGYPRVEIYLVEEDGLAERAHYGSLTTNTIIPFSTGILGRVARTGQSALVPDVSTDPDYYPAVEETVTELAVPICQGSVVIGVINIEADRHGLLTEQDRDLLQVLAGQVSIALENAVLYERVCLHAEDLEQTVTQRTSELTELYELSEKIGYTLSYEELIRLLLSHLRSALRSELVAGGLYFDGYRLQFIETGKPIAPAAMIALRAAWREALGVQEVITHDWEDLSIEVISADDFIARAGPISQIGEIIHAPILIGEETVGVLMAVYEQRDGDGRERERLLSTFAHQAAAAVQRLKSMLAEEQKRLENLVEHLPVGVLLLDDDYRMLMANPLGRAFLSVLKAGNVNGRLSRLGSQRIADLVGRHSDKLPVEITTEGNPRRIFEVQVRPMGKVHRQWVMTLREVTQERDYQTRIQMQDRLATVGQMAAGIAHDFNNIMAAILVYADLMRTDAELTETARNRLGIIQQQVQRASSLIRQILDFSRRSVMEQSSLDLLPFIKELDKMLRRVISETVSLRLSYQPGTYVVKADPTRLQQALLNLAVNGRDAMPEGGRLLFELDKFEILPGDTAPIAEMQSGKWIRISVSDSGVGIPPENFAHIFEPFYTTKPVGQGTGLGLAQVYGIIKQHEGYIDVQSQVGRGTVFNIYLPAQETPEAVNPPVDVPVKLEGNGRKVLVVEDDHATLTALRALLEAHHYQVLTASNGAEALRRYESLMGSVELVVSDVVMPQMGGLALYRKISEQWPQTKVLFITGHPLGKESQELLENGSVSWLQKPFSIQEFNLAVRRLAGERLPEAG